MPRAKDISFTLTLDVNNETFTGKGKSVIDALHAIKPGTMKTRGTFTLEHMDKKSSLRMVPMVIRHLLVNKVAQEIFQKRLITLLQ